LPVFQPNWRAVSCSLVRVIKRFFPCIGQRYKKVSIIVSDYLGMIFFTLLSPNHKDKYLISSHKKRLGKILDAYEFREE